MADHRRQNRGGNRPRNNRNHDRNPRNDRQDRHPRRESDVIWEPRRSREQAKAPAKPGFFKRLLGMIGLGGKKPVKAAPAREPREPDDWAGSRRDLEGRGGDSSRNDRGARGGRDQRPPRGDRQDRDDRGPRQERNDRGPRPERQDRPRQERAPKEDRGPREERPMLPPNPDAVTGDRLHVGNLNYDTTEGDLFELFNGVGKVRNVEIVTNRHNQRSKGFGFVTMAGVAEAKRAVVELHGKEFMNRKLTLGPAKSLGESGDDRGPRQDRANASQEDESTDRRDDQA